MYNSLSLQGVFMDRFGIGSKYAPYIVRCT
ncbi:Uncharacterised protein [Myroides odoratimimus]|uniref:Uncharacterized protein n=1 Tax=Myroides odoratimimus CCUG 10230 TaxID=883150 RepID=A0ABN0E7P7_9FLAO|nr:hypothetical protein HMPREF9712_02669 [Myroides odoratimimus CCUG 10230]EKB02534.1 hypothetical protein HMPREF9711_03319 [Myroides odoratimimus CCUG 3837]EPH08395.1 hypothetical protein HMPREF9713_03351 [Myroides odoratimimus CCUG 12700]SUA32139.1 Uncharacterised protein [Myroides odoratimimus]